MGKVISLKTGQNLGGFDTVENDKLVDEKGFSIGVLTVDNTKKFRAMMEKLESMKIQISQLVEEHDDSYAQFLHEINYVLSHYNYTVKHYDPNKDRLFIGEDGHMWLVDNNERCTKNP